jgi:phosphate transport system protein
MRRIDEDILEVRRLILKMGAMIEERLEMALGALVEKDERKAQMVIESDDKIDQLELEIDRISRNMIVLKQPAAKDLRFVFTAIKITTDLERIGDLLVNIGERVLEIVNEPPLKPYVDLPRMAEQVRKMIRRSLDAFFEGDAELAQSVIADDQCVDDLNIQVFRELLTYMMEDPKNIRKALALSSIAKSLERVGDHTTNIAEMIVFIVQGKDIRHAPHEKGE